MQSLAFLLEKFAFFKEAKAGFINLTEGAYHSEGTFGPEMKGIQGVFSRMFGLPGRSLKGGTS